MSGPVETARAAWGAELPDWVEALAAACAATSQSAVAKRMNRSAAVVSQVLRRKYPGNLAAVEDVFRGAFQALEVACPSMGTIPANECRDWQRRAYRFAGVNSLRVRMFRACRACPRFRAPETETEERDG